MTYTVNIATDYKTFLGDNLSFDLSTFDFSNKSEVYLLKWDTLRLTKGWKDAEQDTFLSYLEKASQRLTQLTSESSVKLVEKLLLAGFHSAIQIASIPEFRFIEKHSVLFTSNGQSADAQAKQLHQKALAKKTSLVLKHTEIIQHGAPHYGATRFANLKAGSEKKYEGLPNYDELFGSQDYCTCPECRSILSPAAYLVDLMRLKDHYIPKVDGPKSFDARRPDLQGLELSCENTNTVVPKLEIVNKVLLNALKDKPENEFSFEDLTKLKYPFNLPFHLPQIEISKYLESHKTSLPDIWAKLDMDGQARHTDAYALQVLELSQGQWDFLTTPCSDDEEKLKTYFGLKKEEESFEKTLSVKDVFLNRTGLSPLELQQLDDLSLDPLKNAANKSLPNLDYINRFVRLAKAIGWSFVDLDWALRTFDKINETEQNKISPAYLTHLAFIQMIKRSHDLTMKECCAMLGNIKGFELADASLSFYEERIFEYKRVPENPKSWRFDEDKVIREIPDLDSSATLDDAGLAIQRALITVLKLNQNDLLLIYQLISKAQSASQKLGLTKERLSTLYRLSLLPRLTGLTIQECFYVRDLIEETDVGFTKKLVGESITDFQQALWGLQSYSTWLKTTPFSVGELRYILTGSTSNVTSHERLISTEGFDEFIKDYHNIKSTHFSIQQFKGKILNHLIAAFTLIFYDKLFAEEIIDENGFVLKVPAESELQFDDLLSGDVSELKLFIIGHLSEFEVKKTSLLGKSIFASRKELFLSKEANKANFWDQLKQDHVNDLGEIIKPFTGESLIKAFPFLDQFNYQDQVNIKGLNFKERMMHFAAVLSLLPQPPQHKIDTFAHHIGSLLLISSKMIPVLVKLSDLEHISEGTGPVKFIIPEKLDTAKLTLMQRYATLFKSLSFSPEEVIKAVGLITREYSIFPFTLDTVQSCFRFKLLVHKFKDKESSLLHYLDMHHSLPKSAGELGKVTGWDANSIESLHKEVLLKTQIDGKNLVDEIYWLDQCFTLMGELGIDAHNIAQLVNAQDKKRPYEGLNMLSEALFAGLSTKYKEEPARISAIRLELEELKRDALLPLVLSKQPIATSDQPYEHLLIDVEVSGAVTTSYIKEAISALQLYIYRCINHLEHNVTVNEELLEWWPWMEHYRTWQANREVFLYPENYIQPELRKKKSQQFEKLESDLLQRKLSDTSVEEAAHNYVEGFAEVLNLKIVGSYQCATEDDSSTQPMQTLYLVGRNRTKPYNFYYRTGIFNFNATKDDYEVTEWSPWVKIELQVNTSILTPVFAFNRLYLFWVETKPKQEDDTKFQASLHYSFFNFNKKWGAPQTLCQELDLTVTQQDQADKAEYHNINIIYYSNEKIFYSYFIDKKQGVYGILTEVLNESILIPEETKNSHNYLDNLYLLDSQFHKNWYNQPHFEYLSDHGIHRLSIKKEHEGLEEKKGHLALGERVVFPDDSTKTDIAIHGDWMLYGTTESVLVYKKEYDQWFLHQDDIIGKQQVKINPKVAIYGDKAVVVHERISGYDYGYIRVYSLKQGFWVEGTALNFKNSDFTIETIVMQEQWLYISSIEEGKRRIEVYEYLDDSWDELLPIYQEQWKKETFSWERSPSNWLSGNSLFMVPIEITVEGEIDQRVICLNLSNQLNAAYFDIKERVWRILPLLYTTDGINNSNADLNLVSWNTKTVYAISKEEGEYLYLKNDKNEEKFFQFRIDDGYLILKKLISNPFKIVDLNSRVNTYLSNYKDSNKTKVVPGLDLMWSTNKENDGTQYLHFNLTGKNGIRLNNTAAPRLSHILFGGGLDKLLSTRTQKTGESSPDGSTTTLDFSSANGLYFWELFFQMPFLVAHSFSTAQQFEEAQKWYQYIFNPTISKENWEVGDDSNDRDQYWRFLPLRSMEEQSLAYELTDSSQLYEYHNDPFDPQAIARLRPVAYQKAIMMHYVENLINWGDHLFSEYSIESIVEATMLYVEASDLLGKKPKELGTCKLPDVKKIDDLLSSHGSQLDIPEFLLHLENKELGLTAAKSKDTPHNYIHSAYFGIPDNEQFLGYWDTVQQRLYNIRHGLNIKGIEEKLPLFQLPIDPMQLVTSMASGGSVAEAFDSTQAIIPNYRFSVIIAKAQSVTQSVIQLGQSLLSVLEKADAEKLSLLLKANEQQLLILIRQSKQDQLAAANQSLNALNSGLESSKSRLSHYDKLIAQGNSPGEEAQIVLEGVAMGFKAVGDVARAVAVPVLAETFKWGEAINLGGQITNDIGTTLSMGSNLAGTVSGYLRRAEDWQLQKKLAEHDKKQVETQIEAATSQVQIAQQDIIQHEKQIAQNQAVNSFFENKFTNQQLYQWMTRKIAALYFQSYHLAQTWALEAQAAWQYERCNSQTFIQPGNWNDLYHGLIAGEALQMSLQHMEKAYMDQNQRRFEIIKYFSLDELLSSKTSNSQTVLFQQKLEGYKVSEGNVRYRIPFEFMQKHFDGDFPSHYCRQIKTITLSFPMLLPPYKTINATLTQTGNRTLLKPDPVGRNYLTVVGVDSPPADILRVDARVSQQIALSQGMNDSGLFELNFNDERYLPFEGTGAVSDWELEMSDGNGIDLKTLSDVIITLKYTALKG